jgi:uncharacterized Zn-binding protein involved in type VI secretion
MGSTVFAEKMGLFHKGSGGTGIAPADVCLSPPPPPAGPIPVPYVNSLSAADLAKGSTKVKIQGEPTPLEDASEISTSMGDEPGTQGGNVVTHKTKGKGFFTLWSFTVKIEGKGVCRHGDMMGQNCASTPPGCVDATALANFDAIPGLDTTTPCGPYPGNRSPTEEQQDACRNGPCWECTAATSGYRARKSRSPKFKGYKAGTRFTPDHQPPQKVAWYRGGCNMKPSPDAFNKWCDDKNNVLKHCKSCSRSQGGVISNSTITEIRGWT